MAAVELVKEFLRDFRPDDLYFNGDIWDMPHISKYVPRRRELNREEDLQAHLDYGIQGVEEIIDAARAERNFLALGNHEDRWENYLGSRAKELASLRALDFEEVFKLKSIKWVPYGEGFWANDSLFIYHGSHVGTTSWTEKEREGVGASTITGHMHKQRVTYFTDRSRSYKSIAQGCLCGLNPPYLRTPPNWQQGFVYGWTIGSDRFRAIETEIVQGEDTKWMATEGKIYEIPTWDSPLQPVTSGRLKLPRSKTKPRKGHSR